jgi:hypothetical protein
MKYAPLASPIRNAPMPNVSTEFAKAVSAAATVSTAPVPRTTRWRSTRVRR